MEFWTDVLNKNDEKQGDGPITTATSLKITTAMDRTGDFEQQMPAADPRAALIRSKRRGRFWGILNGQLTEFGGGGIIDGVGFSVAGKQTMLHVAGGSIARDLKSRSVGFLKIPNLPVNEALTLIMDFAPPGWSYSTAPGVAGLVYARFAGENILQALIAVCDQLGSHFYLNSYKALYFTAAPTPANVRAIQATDPAAIYDKPEICLIKSLKVEEDSYDQVNRIYPFGNGKGDARLNLKYCTRTPPAGYTLNIAENYLQYDAGVNEDDIIEQYLAYKHIGPISHSAPDLENAANVLFDQALLQLKRNAQPYQSYSLEVVGLNKIIYPTQLIRVVYREMVDNYPFIDIDADLIILQTTTTIDQNGLATTALQVATTDRWPKNDVEEIASQMAEGHTDTFHPLRSLSESPISDDKRIGPNSPVQFKCRIGPHVAEINSATLEFSTKPLVANIATLEAVQAVVKNTADGGATTATSAAGGSDAPTSEGGTPHGHTMVLHKTLDTTGLTTLYWRSSTGEVCIVGSGANETFDALDADDTHQHIVNILAHIHKVSIPDHQHQFIVPEHNHEQIYDLYSDTDYPQNISLFIIDKNGTSTNLTEELGGPWAPTNEAVEIEVDVRPYLANAPSGMWQTHKFEFRCTAGKGTIDFYMDRVLTLEAIAAYESEGGMGGRKEMSFIPLVFA